MVRVATSVPKVPIVLKLLVLRLQDVLHQPCVQFRLTIHLSVLKLCLTACHAKPVSVVQLWVPPSRLPTLAQQAIFVTRVELKPNAQLASTAQQEQ